LKDQLQDSKAEYDLLIVHSVRRVFDNWAIEDAEEDAPIPPYKTLSLPSDEGSYEKSLVCTL
jgi:hypothetical protein